MNFLTVTATVGAGGADRARHADVRDFSNYRFWRPYELRAEEGIRFLRQR